MINDDLNIKVVEAMHRIEALYAETNGLCYVSFSGGKDSTIILALIKMCEEIYTIPKEGIKAVFVDTGVELGATREFIFKCKKEWYKNIEIIRPLKSFDYVLKNYGKPIRSKLKSEFIGRYQNQKEPNSICLNYLIYGTNKEGTKQYAKTKIANKDMHILHESFNIKASSKCCKILKKDPLTKWAKENNIKGYIIGNRMGEGGARELNAIKRLADGGKLCTATKGAYLVKMPLIDWTDEDIEKFIERYKVPLSDAYTIYKMNRTGCIGCPFSRQLEQNLKVLYEQEPKRYKACMYWLKDVYIAQNVKLEFDEVYERDRLEKWRQDYYKMRIEMLEKYRNGCRLLKKEKETKQLNIYDYLGE